MPKAFSEREKELIQKRLLEEGHKQFSAYGLKKTNIEEIASAVGISKGAFYLFYKSKEAFFLDVTEEVEVFFRRQVLAVIDQPGPSPRARLYAAFKKAFTLWKTLPILQGFTSGDYEVLARRIPPEQLQEHLSNDRKFISELVARCHRAGIPVTASLDQIAGMMYTLLFSSLHEEDFGPGFFTGSLDLLLELVSAFCLGEVDIRLSHLEKDEKNETIH